jgi:hypothetical protein
MDTNSKIDPIVKLAVNALPGEKKCILFAGAGVSKDARILTAWDLMLETARRLYVNDCGEIDPKVNIEEWFNKSPYAQMTYADIMNGLFPTSPQQQDFLKDYLANKEIGKAHDGIAELARRGIIRAIVTTNFDDCIERALEKKGLIHQVISTDPDLANTEPLIHCKAVRIYKPHGTLGKGILKNTPKDLEKLSPEMEKELTRVLSEHTVIVLGYSGRDEGIQKVFKNRNYGLYPLFWVDPKHPESEIDNILKDKYDYISCDGASEFIDRLSNYHEKLNTLARVTSSGPSISDLEREFSPSNQSIVSLYRDFLEDIGSYGF